MQPLPDSSSTSTNTDSATSSTTGHNFMGVLAGLTTPDTPAPNSSAQKTTAPLRNSNWNDEDLEDDVATLSYESVLKNIGRYKPTDASALNLPKDFDLASAASSLYEQLSTEKAKTAAVPGNSAEGNTASSSYETLSASLPMPTTQPASATIPASASLPSSAAAKAPSSRPTLAEMRKRASVTIRLSEPEYEQLHQRAAEAGLTISAYLRSCTFEAEALRAQVKEALAGLRAQATSEKPAAQASQNNSWRTRLARLRRSGITIHV